MHVNIFPFVQPIIIPSASGVLAKENHPAIRLTYGTIVDVVGRQEDLLACYDGEEGPESAVCGHQ